MIEILQNKIMIFHNGLEFFSKHIKVSYYGDPRYAATLASSGSDSRCGGKNLASDLIQRFF